jgi:hypothetical protein
MHKAMELDKVVCETHCFHLKKNLLPKKFGNIKPGLRYLDECLVGDRQINSDYYDSLFDGAYNWESGTDLCKVSCNLGMNLHHSCLELKMLSYVLMLSLNDWKFKQHLSLRLKASDMY